MKTIILAYHRVFPNFHINPEIFEWQIRHLKERIKPIALQEAAEGGKTGQREFAVTFDDGWADNFIYAYPILKKYNVPATIFVPTKFIKSQNHETIKTREWGSEPKGGYEDLEKVQNGGESDQFLTWEEINKMAPLVTIESHGYEHLHHPDNPPNKVKNDLEKSVKIITEKTGRRPKYLAWPYGEYNKETTKIAKEIGFKACLTTKIGSVEKGDDLFELKRFSPPRNRRAFTMAISGNAGMFFYRLAVKLRHNLGLS